MFCISEVFQSYVQLQILDLFHPKKKTSKEINFEVFLGGKERILSLKLYIRVKIIPWETLHVCETLNLLVNFSINTTYNKPILLIFRPLS